jgi:hypothetical protein
MGRGREGPAARLQQQQGLSRLQALAPETERSLIAAFGRAYAARPNSCVLLAPRNAALMCSSHRKALPPGGHFLRRFTARKRNCLRAAAPSEQQIKRSAHPVGQPVDQPADPDQPVDQPVGQTREAVTTPCGGSERGVSWTSAPPRPRPSGAVLAVACAVQYTPRTAADGTRYQCSLLLQELTAQAAAVEAELLLLLMLDVATG